jgi:hypothetical protein
MLSCQLSWVSQKGSPNANPVQMLIIISIDETLHCLLYIAHLSLYIYIPIQLIWKYIQLQSARWCKIRTLPNCHEHFHCCKAEILELASTPWNKQVSINLCSHGMIFIQFMTICKYWKVVSCILWSFSSFLIKWENPSGFIFLGIAKFLLLWCPHLYNFILSNFKSLHISVLK